jgi:hypothetical protein
MRKHSLQKREGVYSGYTSGSNPSWFFGRGRGERHTRSLIDKELCFAVGRGGEGDSSAIDALGGNIGLVLQLALLQNILISHLVSLLFKGTT